jgi:hypothetical protein
MGLILGCISLSWAIYQDLLTTPYGGQPGTAQMSTVERLPALPAEPNFSMPAIHTFDETVQRPLFSESRRPPEAQPVAKKKVVTKPPEFTVVGIIFSADERIAFVSPHDKGNRSRPKELLQLSEGTKYQGWTVVEIARKEVTLRHNDTEVSFGLDYR